MLARDAKKIAVFLVVYVTEGLSKNSTHESVNLINTLRSNGYIKEEAPQWDEGKNVEVEVSMYIEGMGNFMVSDSTFKVDAYLTLSWQDKRLSHSDSRGVDLLDIKVIHEMLWMPDLYFVNAREANFQNVIKPNHYIHIRPNGYVIYNTRVLMTIACNYDLRNFPFDTQECGIEMMSYSNSIQFIDLQWRQIEPHEINHAVSLSEMEITNSRSLTGNKTYTRVYENSIQKSLWTSASVVFVFGTLFEFAVVYNISTSAKALQEKMASRKENKALAPMANLPIAMRITTLYDRARKIDLVSRLVFPGTYFIFVICYAVIYTCRVKSCAP